MAALLRPLARPLVLPRLAPVWVPEVLADLVVLVVPVARLAWVVA